MEAIEVRRRVEQEHATIRATLRSLEKLAQEVVSEEHPLLGPLRARGEALFASLRDHMSWEDEHLRPVLEAGPGGRDRAQSLDEDHRRQRHMLAAELESLRDQARPTVVIARGLLDVIKDLRAEMDDEEAQLLES